VELLQLRRAKEPLLGTWQPVMGHVEAGETAVMAAVREVEEEVGLTAQSAAWGGMWALEQVHPFYIAAIDAIVLSPRFVVLVRGGGAWSARLNAEHDGARWVGAAAAILPGGPLMWPGQRAALAEVVGALKAAEGDPASRGLPGAQRVG
jgi:8-oxo-dGTP pyrophosphatase MutT (NUDIX family)